MIYNIYIYVYIVLYIIYVYKWYYYVYSMFNIHQEKTLFLAIHIVISYYRFKTYTMIM